MTERPDHTGALEVALYHESEGRKPPAGRRYCIAKIEWFGGAWRRSRRITGPMRLEMAEAELPIYIKRMGIAHVRDA